MRRYWFIVGLAVLLALSSGASARAQVPSQPTPAPAAGTVPPPPPPLPTSAQAGGPPPRPTTVPRGATPIGQAAPAPTYNPAIHIDTGGPAPRTKLPTGTASAPAQPNQPGVPWYFHDQDNTKIGGTNVVYNQAWVYIEAIDVFPTNPPNPPPFPDAFAAYWLGADDSPVGGDFYQVGYHAVGDGSMRLFAETTAPLTSIYAGGPGVTCYQTQGTGQTHSTCIAPIGYGGSALNQYTSFVIQVGGNGWIYLVANPGQPNGAVLMYIWAPSVAGTGVGYHDSELYGVNESIFTLLNAGVHLYGVFYNMSYVAGGFWGANPHLFAEPEFWNGTFWTQGNHFGVCPPWDQWANWAGRTDSYATAFGGGGCYNWDAPMD